MARALYIYVVSFADKPQVCFTVKHEMVDWLARQTPSTCAALVVRRFVDAGRRLHEDRPPVLLGTGTDLLLGDARA